MIYIETATADEIILDQNEVLRYLGYGKDVPEEQMRKFIIEITEEVRGAIDARACCDFMSVDVAEKTVDFGHFRVASDKLSKNLAGCERVLIFAATVGVKLDRIIHKYSSLSPAKAVVAQAVGACAIESFCDLLIQRIGGQLNKNGAYLRPRFSPGYGDFSLQYQRDIIGILQAERRIGISLTEGLLMVPSKSVTAVAGISRERTECEVHGCESCENRENCSYARG